MILSRQTYLSLSFVKRFVFLLRKMSILLVRFFSQISDVKIADPEYVKIVDTLTLLKNDEGLLKCTSCGLCESICSIKCIEITLPTRKSAPTAPSSFYFNPLACISCAMCEDICPDDALRFEISETNAYHYEDREKKIALHKL